MSEYSDHAPAIRSRGRRGSVSVPNWRWEDPELDPFDLRVAGWLASHADSYLADRVTRNEIARRTNVSQGKVTASLARLESLGIIEIQTVKIDQRKGGKRLLITFDYGAWEDEPRSPNDPAPVMPRSPAGHTMTTSVLQGEEQEENPQTPKGAGVSSESPVEEFEETFDRFWSKYPRRLGKPAARRAFKSKLRVHSKAQIAEGLARWNRYWNANNIGERFIPHPSTWLRDERYLDPPPADGRFDEDGSPTERPMEYY